ncbi:hypothetical protein TRFO_12471 [Tritrichomonas foetus]|uniref:UDENN domain-containing protein n=1 Tax=Tritrichomonas foetus TaxID=1144522 RepID=A0A1J4L5U0_9EUKA|nr:hypothetical protein TRFO_12471 [Tritrichomonas foetus]|eukprot:OHT17318.1 hypothetical protein TRFO_12471 [Tritrichomonas foetus]
MRRSLSRPTAFNNGSSPRRVMRFRRNNSAFNDSDDALTIIRRTSDQFKSIIEGVYIIGTYPWQSFDEPTRLLFNSKFSFDDSIIPFIFPHGRKIFRKQFVNPNEMLSEVFEDDDKNGNFVTLYFPEKTNCPYLYCYKYCVSPLTLPSITHEFSLQELISHMTCSDVPYCEICVAIQSKLPYDTLFKNMIFWYLKCETISRIEAYDLIESALLQGKESNHKKDFSPLPLNSGGSILLQDIPDSPTTQIPACGWPEKNALKIKNIIKATANRMMPQPNETITLDFSPFPIFEWTRPMSVKSYFPFARTCIYELVSRVSPPALAMILGTLALEKSMVIYHNHEEVVSRVILALHYMLKPLRWVSGSISILPKSLIDLFHAPNPLLIGTSLPPSDQTIDYANFVFIDLVKCEITVNDAIPDIPFEYTFEEDVKDVWDEIKDPQDPKLNRIIMAANLAIRDILGPAEASIVSDFSDIDNTTSKFVQELYLEQFDPMAREYLTTFSETQMFHLHVEQECRKRSDAIKLAKECSQYEKMNQPGNST